MSAPWSRIACAASALLLSGCDGDVHVVVRAVDGRGTPLQGAEVTLTTERYSYSMLTDESGCADLGFSVKPGDEVATVVVFHEHHRPFVKTIRARPVWRRVIALGAPGERHSGEVVRELGEDECARFAGRR